MNAISIHRAKSVEMCRTRHIDSGDGVAYYLIDIAVIDKDNSQTTIAIFSDEPIVIEDTTDGQV